MLVKSLGNIKRPNFSLKIHILGVKIMNLYHKIKCNEKLVLGTVPPYG